MPHYHIQQEENEQLASNPLMKEWSASSTGLPAFDEIQAVHFQPAFRHAMKLHLQEIEAIVRNPQAPSFENTIAPLSRAGSLFSKVSNTFQNLSTSLGPTSLQPLDLRRISGHFTQIANYPGLFPKIDSLYKQRSQLELNEEQRRLIERYHKDFVASGARFKPEQRARHTVIVQELSQLGAKFSHNVKLDEKEAYLELTDSVDDLAGLPEDVISAAKQAGLERNLSVPIVTTSRSLIEPFLTFSSRRDLREKAWRLWSRRGELVKDRNNLLIAKRMLQLRAEKAKLHGYGNFAEFALSDTMAGSPGRVMQLLEEVWSKAQVSIEKERKELLDYIARHEGDNSLTKIEPWDWRYYAEKVRAARYDLDSSELKSFFPLSQMTEAMFDCARQLFGLEFIPNPELPKYHPDVAVYEVHKPPTSPKQAQRKQVMATLVLDNFSRPEKKSGAWMSSLRSQEYSPAGERVVPIIINNNNFNKPLNSDDAEETLLTLDEVKTMFHEFGHGLHGMLSDVHYRQLAGNAVLRDFVEFPSQLFEHWVSESEVLKKHAKHYQTKESISSELLEKMSEANQFNQGFQTVEYTVSALMDLHLHLLSKEQLEGLDLAAFEQEFLEKLKMPEGVAMRHRLPHFEHLFGGEGYASSYYGYLWADVLAADGFEAFKETGNCFHRGVADRAYRFIYSTGNSRDPSELYRAFRGRDPVIQPLLKRRGLID